MKERLLTSFPAFRYKNYRIYFAAQIVSLIGTWMQQVAQGYLVFQLTHNAFDVGIVAAISNLPTTCFALVGGTLVDRFPRRTLLKTTQILQFIIATAVGILILTNHISLISLAIGAFALGLINAVDQPARISNVAFVVDREHLHSAQAMNMATFNSARIVGPAVAGWLIFAFGIGWAFVLNGLSFLAPFIAYNFIDFGAHIPRPHLGTWHSIKEGVSYAASHQLIRMLLMYMAVAAIFGWSYTTMLPVLAANVFHQDAQGLGLLFSAAGAGSVLGALASSAYTRKLNPTKMIFFGGMSFTISIFLFSLTQNLYFALFCLFIGGFGMITQNSTIQANIQKHVDDHVRGRVASIQSMASVGMTPIGSFQVGLVAEHFGAPLAIRVGAMILFAVAILLYMKNPATKTGSSK